MFLEGAPWRDFFPAGPAGRLTILKQCLEHVLADRRAASENGIGLNGWPDVMSALLESGLQRRKCRFAECLECPLRSPLPYALREGCICYVNDQ
jgi:hypothetical protein